MSTIKDFEYLTFNSNDKMWFVGTGCQYPLVCPKGTKVKFLREYTNCYGKWFEVRYEGQLKYVLPELVDGNVFVDVKEKRSLDILSLTQKRMFLLTDRYGKTWALNEKGELELL